MYCDDVWDLVITKVLCKNFIDSNTTFEYLVQFALTQWRETAFLKTLTRQRRYRRLCMMPHPPMIAHVVFLQISFWTKIYFTKNFWKVLWLVIYLEKVRVGVLVTTCVEIFHPETNETDRNACEQMWFPAGVIQSVHILSDVYSS